MGILAGAFAKLLTTPVANIVTRKQTSALVSSRSKPGVASSSRQASVRDIASQIHSEKGLQGFWSGYSASLVLTLNPSLTFFFYETFKRSLLPRTERDNPSTLATFLLAAMSKAIASTITYPFSLAKARAQASSRTVDDNDQEVKEGLEKVTAGEFDGTNRTRKAARSTIFSTILHIARTEGVGALYEGLGGEVMKGFFSHGITMIVKEAVHKFTIQLYYMVLKMLKRYPSPQELAQQAKERAQTMVGDVSDQASQATTTVSNGTQNLMQKGQDMAQNGSARAQSLYQEGKEQVSNLGSATQTKANAAAQNTSNAASSAYEASKDTASGAYSNSKDTASSAYDTTKNTATAASDKTKNMAGSAYDTTKDTATGAYDKTKDTANTAYDTTKSTANSAYETSKDTVTGAYDNAKDTTNTISSTTKNAGSNTMASANETTERIADYVGKKTENLGRAIRPDSKKSKGEGGEEGS